MHIYKRNGDLYELLRRFLAKYKYELKKIYAPIVFDFNNAIKEQGGRFDLG